MQYYVFTSPPRIVPSYEDAVRVADEYFDKTGNVVAVESIFSINSKGGRSYV